MKVSVIIPVYNAQETIVRALNSVVKQSIKPFEIIIINDGSSDMSLSIINTYIRNHELFNFNFINKKNGGVSSARNAGLKIAKGDYIAFLDSDDEWLFDKTEKQLSILQNNNLNIDFVATLRNYEKLTFPYKIINNKFAYINLKKLLIKVVGQTSTAIFKRKILDNTGLFDESQKYSEDANYWMRIALKNKMIILNETLVITGGGKPSFGFSGLSSNVKGMELGVQKNIDEMYSSSELNVYEYMLFKSLSKLKYFIRIIKLKIND